MKYRCLCLDVDGVLTDGRLLVDAVGNVSRAFHTQDGLALNWFQRLGGEIVILSGKRGGSTEYRALELGIRHVLLGSRDKLADLSGLLPKLGCTLAEVAAVGDDLPDLPLMQHCGYGIAVANAVPEVRAAARYVTARAGGDAAVRDAIEHLLRAAGDWARVVAHFGASRPIAGAEG